MSIRCLDSSFSKPFNYGLAILTKICTCGFILLTSILSWACHSKPHPTLTRVLCLNCPSSRLFGRSWVDFLTQLLFMRLMKHEKGVPLPKFGEWDVNNPASAEGFTVIFNKARDEKKTTGATGTTKDKADYKQDQTVDFPKKRVLTLFKE